MFVDGKKLSIKERKAPFIIESFAPFSIAISINVIKLFNYPYPSVTTENLLVNDCGYRQAVEAICESLPQFNIVATFTFIIKSYKGEKYD